jgi:hypothetical protein
MHGIQPECLEERCCWWFFSATVVDDATDITSSYPLPSQSGEALKLAAVDEVLPPLPHGFMPQQIS